MCWPYWLPEQLAPSWKIWKKARSIFGKARLLHDEQEKIYLSQMDFSAADRLTEKMIDLLLGGKQSGRPGREIHRFSALPQPTETWTMCRR